MIRLVAPARSDRPILLVTSRVPPERVGALRALAEITPVEVAVFEGRNHHFTESVQEPGVPTHRVSQAEVLRLASARGRWRAVIAGTAGRIALPAAWRGARMGGTPFVLWSAMWHEPTTPAFVVARPMLRRIVRDADAVATYGAHVSAHVRALGGRRVHIAPQAVDPAVWVDPVATPRPPGSPFRITYVGRDAPGKGLEILLVAWRQTNLFEAIGAELTLLGPESASDAGLPGVRALGPVPPDEVRAWLDDSDALCVPSERTASFLEPWGLVCNEALHRGVPVVATDAVGAAMGGLVRDGRNGRVVPASHPLELARALTGLAMNPDTAKALGDAGRRDVRPFTYDAWAAGMVAAVQDAEQHAT